MLILNSNATQPQSKTDPDSLFSFQCRLDRMLATPCELRADMSPDEAEYEIQRMVQRSLAAHAFVSGEIGPGDLEEAWFENGFDPYLFGVESLV